jgi:hypothetical protein
MKRRLFISLSGGATSAVMTKKIIDKLSDQFDFTIVFANTGCEDEATLEFVERLSNNFGWNVVWVEALVDQRKGKGIRHKVVDFHTASRNGEPFEQVIKKYGIFNQVNMACTDRTKLEPMRSYLKTQGFLFGKKLNHLTAIGFRSDEADRCSINADKFGFIYPLVRWGITKRDVAKEIKTWGFKLELKGDHYGNCQWCWKKSHRKLMTLANESPAVFDFPEKMEKLYGDKRPELKNNAEDGRAYFFRGNKSVKDIKEEASKKDFMPYEDDPYQHAHDFNPVLDTAGSCGDGCDIGGEYYIEQEFPFMNDFRVHDMDMSY